MIEEELKTRLSAQASLVSLVGAAIYPVEAPPGAAPPYVVYTRTDTRADNTLDPAYGYPEATFAVDAFANGFAAAKALATEVKAALDGWAGEPPAAIFHSVLIDEYDERDAKANLNLAALEFRVKYRK